MKQGGKVGFKGSGKGLAVLVFKHLGICEYVSLSYSALNVQYESKFNKLWDNWMNFSIILGTNADHCRFGYKLQYQAGDLLHFADVGIYSPP